MAPRVLLSSVIQPFGPKHGDGFGVTSDANYQVLWAQDAFRPQTTNKQWGIDFIAANIEVPTTCLHYPNMRQFIRELRRGYDYVGIAFVSPTRHKMEAMVRAVRLHAPQTKVILGGYGTAREEGLAELADHICTGEGVAFMRRLLGEDESAPLVQPDIVQSQRLFSLPMPGKTGFLFAGLGCPNGCDFCATSHYFKRKHIPFLKTGDSMVEAIHAMRRRHPGMVNFTITDEDLLLNETRGRQFLEAMRASDLPPLSLTVFSSVKALSQFTAGELVEMGVDLVWVGYEGQRSGYGKQVGRSYADLFSDFHAHGISVLASAIIGSDYQTETIARQEFEDLMALGPALQQFLIYGPTHGTPLYLRLKAEGRLNEDFMRMPSKIDGFSLVFRHDHFQADQIEDFQKELYREAYARLGPSVFRIVASWLEGYRNLQDDSRPRVREKARRYGVDSHQSLPALVGSRRFAPVASRDWLVKLELDIVGALGPMTPEQRRIARIVPIMFRLTRLGMAFGIGQQPRLARHSYRWPKPSLGFLKKLLDRPLVERALTAARH